MKARQKLEEILQIDQTWDYITATGGQATVTRNAYSGNFSCSCPVWVVKVINGETCKHVDMAKEEYENG